MPELVHWVLCVNERTNCMAEVWLFGSEPKNVYLSKLWGGNHCSLTIWQFKSEFGATKSRSLFLVVLLILCVPFFYWKYSIQNKYRYVKQTVRNTWVRGIYNSFTTAIATRCPPWPHLESMIRSVVKMRCRQPIIQTPFFPVTYSYFTSDKVVLNFKPQLFGSVHEIEWQQVTHLS